MKTKYKHYAWFLLISIFTLANASNANESINWLNCTFRNLSICNEPNFVISKYKYLNGTGTRELLCRAGQKLLFKYEIENKKGNFTIAINGPQKRELWSIQIKDFNRGQKEVDVKKTGIYTIEIKAENTSGNFKLSWEIGE